MSVRKSYFAVPSDSIAPDTTIVLGQLFTDLKRPDQKIAGPIWQPQSTPDIKYAWTWRNSFKKRASASASIQALAALVGLGPTLSGTVTRGQALEIKTRQLETTEFQPDGAYIEASMNAAALHEYISTHPRTNLFMITGLKIARSPSRRLTSTASPGCELGVSWSASPMAIPISGDLSYSYKAEKHDEVSYQTSSDIVLAYKVNKIVTKWGYPTGESREVLGGAVLGGAALGGIVWEKPEDDDDESLVGDVDVMLEDDDDEILEDIKEVYVGYDFEEDEVGAGGYQDEGLDFSMEEWYHDDDGKVVYTTAIAS